jgi:hypothetical protein
MAIRTFAQAVANERSAKLLVGVPTVARMDTMRYGEIREDLVTHYKVTGTRKLPEVLPRLAHLDKFFGGWRVIEITSPEISKYMQSRQAAGAKNGTINREVAVLGKILRYAARNLSSCA